MQILCYLDKKQFDGLRSSVKHFAIDLVQATTVAETKSMLASKKFDVLIICGKDEIAADKILSDLSYEQSIFVLVENDTLKVRDFWFSKGVLYVFKQNSLVEYFSQRFEPKVRSFFEYNIAVVSKSNNELRRMFALVKELDANPIAYPTFEKVKQSIQREEQIDMFLVDMNITESIVRELIELVRYDINISEAPILVCCDHGDGKEALDLFQVGMTNYILRPYLREQVSTQILNVLNNLKSNVELRKLIDELMELDKTKNKFISACSHDLKSPLNSLIGAVEILEDDKMVSEDGKAFVEVLKESSQFMLDVINDLLTISALKQTKSLETEEVDLKKICQNAIASFHISVKKKSQKLLLNIDKKSIFLVRGQELSLKRVLNNLVSNAIKFTPQEGTITISLSEFEGKALLSVADTGIGIPSEMKEKIFDSFTKAGRIGTDGEASTGLGLSLVKDIILKSGGRIEVESEEGKGTKFNILLPKIAKQAKPAA